MGTKKLMASALAGFLVFGASAPIWANPPEGSVNAATPAPATAKSADRSMMGMLAPILADPAQHAPRKTCKPSEVYSQHDVVGDPEACFMGRLDVHGAPQGFGGGVGGF
jgi:hypothetical protein